MSNIVRIGLATAMASAMLLTTASPAHAAIDAHVWDTDGDRLIVRQEPTSASAERARLPEGTTVSIQCQTDGTLVDGTTLWDYLPAYDGYVTDRYLYTGYDGRHPDLPECGTSGDQAIGFDNSNNNPGTIDVDAAAAQFDFAIFKATESTDFVDARFVERFTATHPRMITGAYHFFDPRADGVAQAQHNLAILDAAGYQVSDPTTLPVMVDIEPNYVEENVGFCFDVDAATMNARLADYLAYIIDATGEDPIIYTNGQMIHNCGLDTTPLLDYPLDVPAWQEWNAPEDDPLAVAHALGWDTWTFWQWKANITVPGGVAALGDRFNGDRDALTALAQG